MSGMNLSTQLNGSVVGRLYQGPAKVPAAGIPESGTLSMAAYGQEPGTTVAAGSPGIKATVVGGFCLGLLAFIWWGLPR